MECVLLGIDIAGDRGTHSIIRTTCALLPSLRLLIDPFMAFRVIDSFFFAPSTHSSIYIASYVSLPLYIE